jgi:hypothetical protein
VDGRVEDVNEVVGLGGEGPFEKFVVDSRPPWCRLVGCGVEGSGDFMLGDVDEVMWGGGWWVVRLLGVYMSWVWGEELATKGICHVSGFMCKSQEGLDGWDTGSGVAFMPSSCFPKVI